MVMLMLREIKIDKAKHYVCFLLHAEKISHSVRFFFFIELILNGTKNAILSFKSDNFFVSVKIMIP